MGFPGVAVIQRIQLPMQEMWISSLGQEDPLGKEMTTHSSIFAWETPWTEGPTRWATVHGVANESDRT